MLGQAVVARPRARAATTSRARDRAEPRPHRRRRRRGARSRATAPDVVVNCAACTDVDGAETDEDARRRVNGDGAGQPRPRRASAGARLVHVSTDYVFDGDASARAATSSRDPVAPLGAYGRTKLAGERPVAAAGAAHAIVRTAWLFGAGGRNFVDTMLRLGAERDELQVVDRPGRLADVDRPPRAALLDARRASRQPGIHHVAGGGAVLVVRARASRPSRAAGRRRAASLPCTTDGASPARRRGRRVSVLGTERADARAAADWQRRAAPPISPHRTEVPRMKLLVCGGAGFIGSNFVRMRVRDHGDDVVVLDKLTYAGRQENLARPRVRRSSTARSRTPTPSREAMDGVDAVVNFAAETHVDRSIAEPDAFVTTHALGTYVLLEAARERGAALRAGLDRRGLRLDRGGLVHRVLAARPLVALQRDEGRRRPARRLVLPHVRAARRSSAAARTTTGRTSTPRSSSR